MAELYKAYEEEVLIKLQQIELEILKDFCKVCEENEIDYFGVGGTGIGAIRHKGFIPWDDDIDIGFLRKDYERFLTIATKELKEKYLILNTETDRNYPLMTTRLMLKNTEFREECFKDLPCKMGIFLDLYCFDNVPDSNIKMKLQGFGAWFLGKLMVLCAVGEPVLYFGGWKKQIVLKGCKFVHKLFKKLNITPYFFYKIIKKIITKYEDDMTKRVAYFFDPTPFTSIMEVNNILPTKKMEYDGIQVRFPQKLEQYLEKRYGDYMKLPPENKRHNHPPYVLKFDEES